MGGRGSGGRRVGSGQKPRVLPYVKPPAGAAAHVHPPADWQDATPRIAKLRSQLAFLKQAAGPGEENPQIAEIETEIATLQATTQALAVWHELAPHACEARTLTKASAAAFAMLCRAVSQERATNVPDADHRGLMHRVATWLKDFGLAPLGKPMAAAPSAETPKASKWAGMLK